MRLVQKGTPRSSVVRRIAFGALAAVGAMGCLDLGGSCHNEQLADLASPGGRHRAVVFQRDCGATTGFSTQLSVLSAGATLPDSGGNVFSADTDHGRAPAGRGRGPRVTARWLAPDTLEVRYDARARVFMKAATAADVSVRYIADSRRGFSR